MKTLCLDTSSGLLSLACADGESVGASFEQPLPRRSSEQLLPQARALLEQVGWKIEEVQAVAVSLGPGSFTGLRIGLAFAKGLALGTKTRLLGFGTLQVWAETVREAFSQCAAEKLVVLLDGRRGQVYRGMMSRSEAGWDEQAPQSLLDLEAACEGFKTNGALVSDMEVGFWSGPRLKRTIPLAEGLARLAQRRLGRDPEAADDAATLQPLYLRRSEAEILWEKRHAQKG